MSGRQDGGAKAVRERAAAARRAAQLRREAEERVEAQAKLDDEEPITVNDVLAMLGSAFRVPEEQEPKAALKQAYVDDAIAGEMVAPLLAFLNDGTVPEPPAEPEPTTSTRSRRKTDEAYTFTAEDIRKLRDDQGLSWRQVAVNLDLGSPGAARKAYTTLTGLDYHSSVMTGRRAKSDPLRSVRPARKVFAPVWNDDTDQDEIIDKLRGATITVRRTLVPGEEFIDVGRVTKLSWDGKDEALCVHFTEKHSGGSRAVRVANIMEVH